VCLFLSQRGVIAFECTSERWTTSDRVFSALILAQAHRRLAFSIWHRLSLLADLLPPQYQYNKTTSDSEQLETDVYSWVSYLSIQTMGFISAAPWLDQIETLSRSHDSSSLPMRASKDNPPLRATCTCSQVIVLDLVSRVVLPPAIVEARNKILRIFSRRLGPRYGLLYNENNFSKTRRFLYIAMSRAEPRPSSKYFRSHAVSR
jgi:hypothetical protein